MTMGGRHWALGRLLALLGMLCPRHPPPPHIPTQLSVHQPKKAFSDSVDQAGLVLLVEDLFNVVHQKVQSIRAG